MRGRSGGSYKKILPWAGCLFGLVAAIGAGYGLWSLRGEEQRKADEHLNRAWDALGGNPNTAFLTELPLLPSQEADREEAKRLIGLAKGLRPKYARVYLVEAMYFLAERDTPAAADSACRGLRLSDGSASAFAVLGRVLEYHEDPQWGICAFRKATSLESSVPGSCYHYNLGIALYDADYVREAIVAFRADTEHGHDDADTHFNLALALEDVNRRYEALDHYEKAIDRRPAFADAYHNMGLLLERIGRDSASREALAKASSFEDTSPSNPLTPRVLHSPPPCERALICVESQPE